MTPFQVLLLVILGILATGMIIALTKGRIGRIPGALILVVLGIGILASIEPNRTTAIARSLGIARGTDLLLYLMVLAVLQGFLLVYLRLRRVRRELTILVRKLALLEARGVNRDGNVTPPPTDNAIASDAPV
ncbi:MAG: DUF2304 domain-containing protein [Phycisphaerales bacterium]|nr:DUF2304 domain-containing protein [Phycisphaerales bacterium]